MAERSILTVELLRKLVRYEPDTGKLFWLPRDAEHCRSRWPGAEESQARRWNGRFAGKECFKAFDSGGYHNGSIFDLTRKAHQVAWALMTGEWPDRPIDHINGDRGANYWTNLRAATWGQNSRNSLPQRNAASRFKGVTWHKRDEIWFARILVEGKRLQIGTFVAEETAARAYDAAAKVHFGEFAKLNFP